MRKPDLIHSKMLDRLPDFYDKVGTIKEPVKDRTNSGAETRTYVAVAGMEAIPCRLAIKRAAGGETRSSSGTVVVAPYEATLSGWYSQITEEMRLEVDSVQYDILLSQADSAGKTTHLDLQIVR